MYRPSVKRYDVRVTVKSITIGECPQGFKPGDTWLVKNKTPNGMCLGAFSGLYSTLNLLRFGGERPYDEDGDVILVSCPDLAHRVIYELRRLRDD